MADIKRPFRSYNGSGWDRHLFETSEDQIVTGWTQEMGYSGFKKLPGGLILQWVQATISKSSSSAEGGTNITLPLAMKILSSVCSVSKVGGKPDYIHVYNASATGISEDSKGNCKQCHVGIMHVNNTPNSDVVIVDVFLAGMVV